MSRYPALGGNGHVAREPVRTVRPGKGSVRRHDDDVADNPNVEVPTLTDKKLGGTGAGLVDDYGPKPLYRIVGHCSEPDTEKDVEEDQDEDREEDGSQRKVFLLLDLPGVDKGAVLPRATRVRGVGLGRGGSH